MTEDAIYGVAKPKKANVFKRIWAQLNRPLTEEEKARKAALDKYSHLTMF